MKYIKLLLISLMAFFILFTLIGLLFPSSVHTAKAVVVNKKQAEILTALKNTGNWLNWFPFFYPPVGAASKTINSDTTFFYNDKKEVLLINLTSDSNTVSFLLTSTNGAQTASTIAVLPVNAGDEQTQVMWKETEQLKWYPWDRFRGLLLEGTKGIYLDTALSRFKRFIEAQP